MENDGLEVVRFLYKTKHNSMYLVRCRCGAEFEIRKSRINGRRLCKKCSDRAKLHDMSGMKFGRLTVIDFNRIENKKTYWNCICECGNKYIARNCALTSGNTKSCGCLGDENRAYGSITHGMSKTEEYGIWSGMITRCENTHRNASDRYVNRGIKICDKWRFSFESFLKDMGPRPSKKHTIDRIDNDGDYEPGNCRWVTIDVQANNTSKNRIMVISGERMTIAEASRMYGIKYSTMINRIKRGWPDDVCAFTPTRYVSPKGTKHV